MNATWVKHLLESPINGGYPNWQLKGSIPPHAKEHKYNLETWHLMSLECALNGPLIAIYFLLKRYRIQHDARGQSQVPLTLPIPNIATSEKIRRHITELIAGGATS